MKDSIEIKEVVAIGPDVKNIEPGDKVIFNFRNLPEIVSDPVLTKQETFIKTSGIKVPGPELLDVKEVPVTYVLARAHDVMCVLDHD